MINLRHGRLAEWLMQRFAKPWGQRPGWFESNIFRWDYSQIHLTETPIHMAKSALRRHHAERLLNKWNFQLKHYDYMQHVDLSIGKIYSKDPFDCGRSNCGVCSLHKKFKSPRIRGSVPYHNNAGELFDYY